jgi:hypothetical protein
MSLRQHLARTDDARALLREIFVTAADLCPDQTAGTLTVNLHHLSNACSDQLAAKMAEELNATETVFPGTKLRVRDKLVPRLRWEQGALRAAGSALSHFWD